MAASARLTQTLRPQGYIYRQCTWDRKYRLGVRHIHGSALRQRQASESWSEKAGHIKSGAEMSMLTLLQERGFVKDVAGGSKALDWLLTEKPIGAYVGVDPTAPSLHVGHLLPLMALYWMHLCGFPAVTLLGNGTVSIGDPSGRSTGRKRQNDTTHTLNSDCMATQLERLWKHVNALGAKHRFSKLPSANARVLYNKTWLQRVSAVTLLSGLGSGMRLGSMLSRDSVKVRMENGEGMAMSEFSYPLFQAYDWWHMYSTSGIQMQIGGSDQYGNICAGMDAISHMRSLPLDPSEHHLHMPRNDPRNDVFGLSTPLMTTATGEKFGKSAGNAIWLDENMLSSFDLYQYFLKTADADVERYLKLFTFLPMESINMVMEAQENDASRRVAQHLLAKEVVELAHGAVAAKQAETAHKEAFANGTHTFSLGALRKALRGNEQHQVTKPTVRRKVQKKLTMHQLHKQQYLESSGTAKPAISVDSDPDSKVDNIITLPITLLKNGSFPQLFYAAGLVSSKSEAQRLIKNRGAYVVLPNSGSPQTPFALQWVAVPEERATDPNHYLIDWDAIVLRIGKTKIQVCHVVPEDQFDSVGQPFPGWEEFKAKRSVATRPTVLDVRSEHTKLEANDKGKTDNAEFPVSSKDEK